MPLRKTQEAIRQSRRKALETLRNWFFTGIVVGARRAAPASLDLPWCGAVLRQNGAVEETGLAAGVQGHPAIGVAWLANKLAQFDVGLEPGHVIMPGSCTRMVPVVAGDVVRADFDGLGHVSVRFA